MSTAAVPERAPGLHEYCKELEVAAQFVLSRLGSASVAIVLGSGLSGFIERFSSSRELPYNEIPFMPTTSVPGHSGKLVLGELPCQSGSISMLCFAGRVHSYEGFNSEMVNFYTRLSAAIGCSIYILTNSAGGTLPGMVPGSAMIIRDHMRWTNVDPLQISSHDVRLGPLHYSPASLYSERLTVIARQSARRLGQILYEGTYCWTSGPAYETKAEVQAGIAMKVGAFGMSTVPESLAAGALGMEVFAISLCTNLASGLGNEKLIHEDVTRVAKESGPNFEALLLDFAYHLEVVPPRRRSMLPCENSQKLPSLLLPGPVPYAWSNGNQIDADASALRVALSLPPLNSATVALFVLNPGTAFRFRKLLKLGADSSPMLLTSVLTEFQKVARSANAVSATISTAAFNNVQLFIIEMPFDEGFCDNESYHFLGVINRIRDPLSPFVFVQVVASYATSIESSGAKPKIATPTTTSEVSFMVVENMLDRTQDEVFPYQIRPSYRQLGLSKLLVNEDTAPTFREFAGSLMVLPGPSRATPAELSLANLLGCSRYTVTSCSPLFHAWCSGAHCQLVAQVDLLDHGAEAVSKSLLFPLLSRVIPPSPLFASPCSYTLTSVPRIRHMQESLREIQEAAAFCRAASPLFALCKSAWIIDQPFSRCTQSLQFLVTVPCSSMPYFPTGPSLIGANWLMSACERNSQTILILHCTSVGASDKMFVPTLYNLTFAIRVLRELGCAHLILSGTGTSVLSDIRVGQFTTITDHINLSGRNPLSGINVAEFGVRFPDMSNVYSGALHGSVVALLPHITICSPKLADLGQMLGFQVVTNGLIPEVIVAVHGGMTTRALIWIHQSVYSSEALAHFPDVDIAEFLDSLDKMSPWSLISNAVNSSIRE